MDKKNTLESRRGKARLTLARVLVYLFLIFLSVLCLFSFYMLFINATRTNAQLQGGFSALPEGHFMENLKNAWNDASINIPKGLLNSFFVAGCTAILTTYFSALTAYGIHAYDFKLKKAAFTFIMAIMVIPSQVSAAGFVQLCYKFHLTNKFWPLILPGIAAPVVFFYMKQYMESVLPMEIVEAARVDGATRAQVLYKIILPLAKPIVIYTILTAFMGPWGDYVFARYISFGTSKGMNVAVGLYSWLSKDQIASRYTMFCAGGVLVAIPVAVLFMCLQKYYVEGVTGGAVKG